MPPEHFRFRSGVQSKHGQRETRPPGFWWAGISGRGAFAERTASRCEASGLARLGLTMQVHSRADIMSDDGHHNPIDSDDDFEGELELSFPFPLDPGDASDAGNDDAPYEGLALHHVPPLPLLVP